jgi:two-component system, cell cycle response regulator DivK
VLLSIPMIKANKKILLVEDNDDCRELLALSINRLGYAVFEAATGRQAVERACAVHPDLIMMDLGLPGMSGDEATACLKANPATKEIPVIINTGFVIGPQLKRALDAGAAEVLRKPFHITALYELLSRYLSAKDEPTITAGKEMTSQRSAGPRKRLSTIELGL